jgi:insertion element IS1 protein InsB
LLPRGVRASARTLFNTNDGTSGRLCHYNVTNFCLNFYSTSASIVFLYLSNLSYPKSLRMHSTTLKCNRCVDEKSHYTKYGRTKTGNQRYKCKTCNKIFLEQYSYKAYTGNINEWIKTLLKEGCGIRSIARVLDISPTTVLKRIINIAASVKQPVIAMGKEYEVDELRTYYQKKTKLLWIAYALRKDTREVIAFIVGNRTNNTLRAVTDTLILSNASAVYTDRFPSYRSLLPVEIHKAKPYNINHIERKNLSLRTHLKRLNRKTICFSRSKTILAACLKIYFWSN